MEKTYFERIEEKIRKKEEQLGRKTTIEEQDEIKFEAMKDAWVEASEEVASEEQEEINKKS
jgi:hypothetical protein